MTSIVFYAIASLVVLSALMVVSLKNLFHCALFLAVAMFGISGIFLFLGSEFLAAVQVLIYVGAVTILVIFGIMLTRNVMDEKIPARNSQVLISFLVGVSFVLVILFALGQSIFQWTNQPPGPGYPAAGSTLNDIYALGPALILPSHGFAFAFEFVSILLLSALVGAIVIARKDPS
jgi:NADH:ubiquinone oxidoreductase subunit 6 (subunit J)